MSKKLIKSEDILNRISELSSEADWTDEELDQELLENGIDPKQLVNEVMTVVRKYVTPKENDNNVDEVGKNEPLPLLGLLKKRTGLRPIDIAKALNLPIPFLSNISRCSKVVPRSWQLEMAKRVEQSLRIDTKETLHCLEQQFQYNMAASRDEPYKKDDNISYKTILDRSSLSPEEKQFWLSLATEVSS